MTEDSSRQAIILLENVNKSFGRGRNRPIPVLHSINLAVEKGEFVVIYGPSGCGKTTLLNTISGLEPPTTGKVELKNKKIYDYTEGKRTNFRRETIGMVYQSPYWVKSLNLIENVALPLLIEGKGQAESFRQARLMLRQVGMKNIKERNPSLLSGGEQQRSGIARALITNPSIIIADEPTGNLDSKSGDEIINLFKQIHLKNNKTFILVTHDEKYWSIGSRKVEMKDGKIVREYRS